MRLFIEKNSGGTQSSQAVSRQKELDKMIERCVEFLSLSKYRRSFLLSHVFAYHDWDRHQSRNSGG